MGSRQCPALPYPDGYRELREAETNSSSSDGGSRIAYKGGVGCCSGGKIIQEQTLQGR